MANVIPAGMESDCSGDEDFFGGDNLKLLKAKLEDSSISEEENLEEPTTFPYKRAKSRGYSSAFNSFRLKNEPLAQDQDELEAMLYSAGLKHLLVLFKDVTLRDFLIMNDSDLEKLGVAQVVDRKRLQQLIADFHLKPWAEKSLIEPGPYLSCTEATKLISNVHSHVVCMESTLVHLRQIINRKQLPPDKETDKPTDEPTDKEGFEKLLPTDKENFKKLLRELDHTLLAIPKFENSLRALRKDLQKLNNAGGIFESPDDRGKCIALAKLRNGFSSIGVKKVALFALPPAALFLIYRKFMEA